MNTAENIEPNPIDEVKLILSPHRNAIYWGKVSKAPRPKGCWEWIGWRDKDGYGAFRFDGGNKRAHRLSYWMHIGPIPDGMWVLHRCDNPSCVNPDHLWIGTNIDNINDKVAKGRQATGDRINKGRKAASGDRNGTRTHPESLLRGDDSHMRINPPKLTMNKAEEIRASSKAGERSSVLARRYSVSPATICDVIYYRTWAPDLRHVKSNHA